MLKTDKPPYTETFRYSLLSLIFVSSLLALVNYRFLVLSVIASVGLSCLAVLNAPNRIVVGMRQVLFLSIGFAVFWFAWR